MAPRPDQDVTAGERSPRVRPQLDVATILEAALRLSGAGNPEPLTVRSLGKELGADPTAIYRHFRDKDELVHAVLDRLIHRRGRGGRPRRRLARADDPARPGDPGDLRRAPEHRRRAVRPRPPGAQGELAAIELILVAMNEAGLDRQDSVRFYGGAVVLRHLVREPLRPRSRRRRGRRRGSRVDRRPPVAPAHPSPGHRGRPRRARGPPRPRHLRVRGAGHPRRGRGTGRSLVRLSRTPKTGNRTRRSAGVRRAPVGNPDRQVPLPTATRRGPLALWQGDSPARVVRSTARSP